MKSPICTILLSKSEFSFALLLVTFEPLEVEQSYIPHLKALMCGINAAEAQGCDCMSFIHSAMPIQKWVFYFIKWQSYVSEGPRLYV